jgi:hypothetical protein
MRPLRVILVFFSIVVLFQSPSFSEEPLKEGVAPDPIQAASNFITGLTGQTPAMLGLAGDLQDLAAIGEAIIAGDFSKASHKLGEVTAGKVIGYTAPAIGQIIAIGNIGKMAGDAAVTWVGQKNFEKIYATMLEVVGPVENWPKTREEALRDEFFQATMAAEYRYLETYLIERGYAKDRAEAEKVAIDMILAKGSFERLCNQYGLEGKERTYENLKREIESEAQVSAEMAREEELARVEELKAKEAAKEKQEEEAVEAELVKEMAALDKEKEQDELDEKPKPEQSPSLPKPGDTLVVPVDEQDDKPKPEKPKPTELISWSVSSSAGEDQTAFTVTVNNISGKTIEEFACEVEPIGSYSEGGVGWGSSPSFSIIAPEQSISFVVLAMGDVKGVGLSFKGNGKLLGGQELASIHRKKEISADGSYRGGFAGNGISGKISISIRGSSVNGALSGNYKDSNQNVSITGSISGSYNPETGGIYAKWSGMATGSMRYEGKLHDVYEPIFGKLEGVIKKGSLAGSWSGGSEYVELSGSWEAK